MPLAVILEHVLPDGSTHFDWMLEDPALSGEHALRTWRVARRPDLADAFEGERIGDHRRVYLRFEGEVPGGRGTVRRLNAGSIASLRFSETRLGVEIDWENGGIVRYDGENHPGGIWRFHAVRGKPLDAQPRL